LKDELCAAVHGLNSTQTQLRPNGRPDAWTIQQIVEHLLLTYRGTVDVLETRLAKGVPTKKRPTVGHRVAQFTVVKAGYFPRGMEAPEPVQPRASAARSGEELAASVHSEIDGLGALVDRCERVLGRERSVTHFILGPMSMAQWTRFHLVHGNHHVKQIRTIRRQHAL
jgi:hypothetical protein